ncbi:hypothetical protein LOC68_02305 [Blastopirellula sp. JC732]|uniref:Uncharacterized protein n=1 Tax=Blastopirellula sediminis TaxID=2894196 RepID=A0A9X1MJ40_9BACT|nr:hypothetical protein [Blastopirellula sediminis]MCC9607977.1 hypothetical protein [Blastopirellula sediminis]MCC9627230.1 hypothetical protein [Blastopirellula sediminis]
MLQRRVVGFLGSAIEQRRSRLLQLVEQVDALDDVGPADMRLHAGDLALVGRFNSARIGGKKRKIQQSIKRWRVLCRRNAQQLPLDCGFRSHQVGRGGKNETSYGMGMIYLNHLPNGRFGQVF